MYIFICYNDYMNTKRIITVGDPHGCLTELKELLEKVKWDPINDNLIVLGDLVDRGPDSPGVVKFCRENNISCCLGNHEEKYLRFVEHAEKESKIPKYKNPMRMGQHKKDIIDKLTLEDIAYIKSMSDIIKLTDNWYAVHAGLNPTKDITRQCGKELSYIRYVKEDGTPIEGASPKESKVHWSDKWNGQQNVIYGHYIHSRVLPRLVRNSNGAKIWGIDTGCCFGGYLTALILPEEQIVQVKAKQEYMKYIT